LIADIEKRLKHKLLAELREQNVFVLEKGAIEDYYPATVVGGDKPSKAQHFCKTVNDRATAIALCSNQLPDKDGKPGNEFEMIFGSIFA
jgi:putative ATP-dependent endonuclease of the OLD family